jgi:hypothetical protein
MFDQPGCRSSQIARIFYATDGEDSVAMCSFYLNATASPCRLTGSPQARKISGLDNAYVGEHLPSMFNIAALPFPLFAPRNVVANN